MANLKANDIALGTWVKHKRTKTLAKVWNVDPSLGKFQLEDPYGNKDKMWRSAKDWTLAKAPKQAKPAKYKLGAKYSSTFDYDGMLAMALKATYSWGKDKLRKLFDSFEDVNYHTAAKNLWNAIQSFDDKAEAEKYLKLFQKDVKTEMLSENKDKKMNELFFSSKTDALDSFKKDLLKHVDVKKAAKFYGKKPEFIVKMLQKKIKVGKNSISLVYNDVGEGPYKGNDSASGIKFNIKKDVKMNEARELSPLQKAYSEFFFDMLAQYEVETPAKLDDATKKKFFNQVKTDWAKKKVQLAKQGIKPKSLNEEKAAIKNVLKKTLNETGEWDEDEGKEWKKQLEKDMKWLARSKYAKLKGVHGFDMYQGPYAIMNIHGRDFKVWTQEHDELWIDGYPIDNTSKQGMRPGFLGDRNDLMNAIDNAKEMLKGKKSIKLEGSENYKPKFKKDDVVYNKRTKTIGIVRLPDDKYGEVKTDADGNVDVDEVEYYNPMKNTKHKSAKVAPSTKKEIEKRHLWKPFSPRTNEAKIRGIIRKEIQKIFESRMNEVASRTAVEIGGFTGMNKDAIQKFVDDNNLDIEKVYQFVKKGNLKDRMKLVSAIAGRPNNPVQKQIIKQFSESVNEAKKVNIEKVKKGDTVTNGNPEGTLISAPEFKVTSIEPLEQGGKKYIILKGKGKRDVVKRLVGKQVFVTEAKINELTLPDKFISGDEMVQLKKDAKGWRELTAAINPKTKKPIQKFGFDKGNEIADSRGELVKKLKSKYKNNWERLNLMK